MIIFNNYYYNKYYESVWSKKEDKDHFTKLLTGSNEYDGISYDEWLKNQIKKGDTCKLENEVPLIIAGIRDGIELKNGEQIVSSVLELGTIIRQLEESYNISRGKIEFEIQNLMEISGL